MLPFDQKPWAKALACTVIGLSVVAALFGLFYFRSVGSLHISELVGIFLLLLTIIPPNVAIVLRKPEGGNGSLPSHLRSPTSPKAL